MSLSKKGIGMGKTTLELTSRDATVVKRAFDQEIDRLFGRGKNITHISAPDWALSQIGAQKGTYKGLRVASQREASDQVAIIFED
jgi:hypothetical protein